MVMFIDFVIKRQKRGATAKEEAFERQNSPGCTFHIDEQLVANPLDCSGTQTSIESYKFD